MPPTSSKVRALLAHRSVVRSSRWHSMFRASTYDFKNYNDMLSFITFYSLLREKPNAPV